MNLSDRATQAAQRSTDAATTRLNSELQAEGALVAERVADLLGFPATYLDSMDDYHPVESRNRGGYGTYISRDWHRIHRLLVDDVTFWWVMPTHQSEQPHAGAMAVERPCRNCGQATFAEINSLDGPAGYDALLTPESRPRSTGITQDDMRRRYEETRSEKARADYVLAIGRALRKEPLCWDCKIGIPHMCPTCGRSNDTL